MSPTGVGTVVTVGSFDGVHTGHWAVLDEIVRRARESGRRSLLVTFDPHPLEVVNPAAAPPLLTSGEEKREILAQSGLDVVAFVRFTRELADTGPEDFVRDVLRERFHMQELVIGHDHGFGKGRSGNVDLLRRLAAADGFAVDVVAEVDIDQRPVSSTLIRRAIAGGDLDSAARWLGRRYAMVGRVHAGAGRGRQIGFPTINVAPTDKRKLLPPDGVYAVWVECRRGHFGGMMNQGARPTFDEQARKVEVHLFGAVPDLYGELVKIAWVARLRDIRAFSGVEALRRQLEADAEAAQGALT